MRSQATALQPLADEDAGETGLPAAPAGLPQTEEEWRRFVELHVFGGRPIQYSQATVDRAAALLVPRP
jgi:hypothetical protein